MVPISNQTHPEVVTQTSDKLIQRLKTPEIVFTQEDALKPTLYARISSEEYQVTTYQRTVEKQTTNTNLFIRLTQYAQLLKAATGAVKVDLRQYEANIRKKLPDQTEIFGNCNRIAPDELGHSSLQMYGDIHLAQKNVGVHYIDLIYDRPGWQPPLERYSKITVNINSTGQRSSGLESYVVRIGPNGEIEKIEFAQSPNNMITPNLYQNMKEIPPGECKRLWEDKLKDLVQMAKNKISSDSDGNFLLNPERIKLLNLGPNNFPVKPLNDFVADKIF